MKKLLLSLAAVAGIALAGSAAEVTFDFSTADKAAAYGIPSDKNTYVTNPTTVKDGPVSLTFSGSAAEAWRWWDDGMRAYGKSSSKKPTLTVAVNGGEITQIVVNYNKTGATYEANIGTWKAATDKKSGTWTGADKEVILSMTASSNIAAAYTVTVTYTGGEVAAVEAPKVICEKNTVTITADGADAIYYTVDGTEPTTSSTKYTAPFAITENTTVKTIATKGSDVSAVTTYNAVYEGSYADFAAFVAANTTGTVEGPISVLYQSADRRYLWLQDKNKGYMLAYTSNSDNSNPTLVNGDVLSEITGKYSPYNSLPEMVPSAFGTVTKGTAVEPNELTVEELALDMVNEYIVLKNVTISGLNGKNFTITDETGTVAGYNNIGTDLIDVPEGEGFTLTGFVCRFKDTLQVTPISVTGGEIIETVATPVFNPGSGVIAAGTEVEITCATEGAAIFYTTDGTEPSVSSTEYTAAIAVSEAMTIKAIAVKEGWNNSAVAEAQYIMLDKDATVATFDFANVKAFAPDFAVPTAESTGENVAGMKFTYNNVTLSFAENDATNVARIWMQTANAGGTTQLRVFTSDSFTVSVPDSFVFEAIDFVTSGANYLGLATETGSYAVDTDDAKLATWRPTADLTRSVTFTVSKNSRINSMTVTMRKAPNGVDDITVADENAPVEYYNLQGVLVANPTAGLYLVKKGNTVTKQIIR